jgi:hypothetical protein
MNAFLMRRLILLLLFFGCYQATAQTFEGSLQWSIKLETPGEMLKNGNSAANADNSVAEPDQREPAVAPELPDNAQRPSEPVAKIKRPEEAPRPDLPKTLLVRTKNGNSLIKTDLDKQPETLYLKSKNQMFHLNHRRKVFTELKDRNKNKAGSTEVIPEFLKSSESEEILDYTCTKYARTYKRGNNVLTQEIWATTEINDLDLRVLGKLPIARNIIPIEQVQGVPLKIVFLTPEGRLTMQATEVKREKIDDKYFKIPDDYRDAAVRKKK